ncbi:highly reducing polyketide synthase 40-like [Sparus aurata]|uniref:highly reducing polyketide synthase 40-like n=1 Tax=Sparus aurata TaxID=8175 RepID=UPI0011C1B94D|nr:highly reducing polyketide synthase 40-like [Sparus aurata]
MEDAEDDIAVIGIGCNFPGGEGLDNFWRVLLEGKNCVVDIPAERFDTNFWYDADESKPGKTQTTKAALIEGFNEFDHKFFGITEAEAGSMDPQHKLLLQCTYRALEDAGFAMESINGSRTGVYIGLMNKDYEMLQSNSSTTISHYNCTGTAMSVAANRISFTFNLTGPSFAIDSACSSSLVALHLACQAIKQGDCEMALCGGVSCIIEPKVYVALSKAKMISPEGTSKPFSSRADGYGRGEGCGVVLLKPLKNALKDCNKIWGIISKTAVNQDGRSVTPITKPSMTQQEELLRRIYSESDLANVQYIEAHGTGTPVGDPTEAGSISNIIAKAKPPGSEMLRIGSVKSNIGHTESAAGVAGLIKVLLMMKHATIVPSVFYSEDSASVDVKSLRMNIPIKAERWKRNWTLERVAGINSFGFGGTNAHAIVSEYRRTDVPSQIPKGCPKLFVISAASEKSLILSITDTQRRLCSAQTVDLQALLYTSACGRSHVRHKYRKAFQTSSLSDLESQLTSALKAKFESVRSDIQVVFVFCGNGVAYKGMCKQLMREIPVFRDKVREVENLFKSHQSIGISQWLAGENDNDFSKPNVVQPLLFAIQVAIAAVLKQWGVKPDAMLGHSVGEVAAAHCSGLLSLEDAVKVLHHRSSLQSKVTGGKMLIVGNVATEKVLKILPEFSGKVCVAAFNSPHSCTLSGDADAINLLHQRLRIVFTEKNLFLHELDVPAAYHSHMMDPVLDDIEKSIDPLVANDKNCKLFSTVTGDSYSDGDFTTGRYWARNIREAVLFEQTLRAATKDKKSRRNTVFVEIGPRTALRRNIHETLGDNAIVLSSVQPGRDYDTILSTVAKLFELGISVDWAWEILRRVLSKVKQQHRKLLIISSSLASALLKVLALTANRSGWNVSSQPNYRQQLLHFDQSRAVVFLPPFDRTWRELYDSGGHDRHFIFVCSDHMSSTLPANMFALKSEHMHVHKVDVANVLQRANLRENNRNVSNWLMSLGFNTSSLPLKRETLQVSHTKEPQTNTEAESYFTTKNAQQVVLHHRESDCPVSDIPLLSRPVQLFKQNCVYIVTGGLSGLGLETVKFIAHNGGGCIATLSRSTPTDEMQSEMELLQRKSGVTIMNVQCDVSVSMQVVNAISKIEQRFSSCPIKGVFHSAAVLHDALIETLDQSLFRKVLQPKVSGALNLHYATLHNQLDFFVCYSSISSFIGNPSQCNYAAANSFLDMFCHYRRNLGLAGQSINWGPLNLGLLLNKDHFQKFLEAKGMMTMDVCDIQEALEKCLLMNRPQQVICKFNFKNLHIHVLSQNASLRERLSALVEIELKDYANNELRIQRLSSPHGSLRTIVSDISNVGVDELHDDSALCALGIDSMSAMTLQNKVFQETGVNIPLVKILDPNSTLTTLETIVMKNE